MKTRKEVEDLKFQWRFHASRGVNLEDTPGFEDHASELKHFRLYIEAGEGSIWLHNFAAELGLLDNMPLAKKIMDIESRLDEIAHPDND